MNKQEKTMNREELKAYNGESIYRVLEFTPINDDERHLEEYFENNSEFKFYEKSEADKVMDEMEAENARLKAKVPKWHSVADGDLPPKYKLVLVRYNYDTGHSYEEHFTVEMHTGEVWNNLRNYDEQPTHWMQLPPPPTKDSSATEKENG